MGNIEDIIAKCAEGIETHHKSTKDENGNQTYYCPLCTAERYCLYVNKDRLLEIENRDEEQWKYSYMYECLRPFVKNMQKKGKGYRGNRQ